MRHISKVWYKRLHSYHTHTRPFIFYLVTLAIFSVTIPVIERLEVDERADLAIVVIGEVEGVPRGEVCRPVQEEELPHPLDLAVKLMKVLSRE